MFNAINSSNMNSLKIIQGFSRTPEDIQEQQDVFQGSRTKQVLTANSRTILGAQGRLATLGAPFIGCAQTAALIGTWCKQAIIG